MPMVRSWPWACHGMTMVMDMGRTRTRSRVKWTRYRLLDLYRPRLTSKTGKHARINNHSRSMCWTIHNI